MSFQKIFCSAIFGNHFQAEIVRFWVSRCSNMQKGFLKTIFLCNLFWNLKGPVLVRTLSYRQKVTDHLLLIDLFHKLIQGVGHNMLHLDMQLNSCHHCTLSLHTPVSYLPPMTTDAELSRQFPLAIDLKKKWPDLLKLRTKGEKLDIQFSQQA